MKKILVIEDNTDVRENLCEILQLADYDVYEASNGKIGLTMAKQHSPHLILCDVMMPELDGFGFLKILNKSSDLHHIPVIFLTAKAEKSDLRKGMGLGADDYITKPFDDTELLEAIEIRLKKSEKISKVFDKSDESLQQFFSEARAKDEFQKLSENKEIRKYNKNDIVFDLGQSARWLYFLIEGQVKEYKTNEYGKELITQIYRPGEFFGYFPILSEANYTTISATMEESSIRLIPKEDFKLLIFNNRDFAAQFIKMISDRSEKTEQQLIDMAYSSVRKKVANALVAYCTSEDSPNTINVSREDLATKAGTAKETLIRTLSDFKSEKLISIEGKSIIVNDTNELANLIG